jgi:acetyl esterase
MRNLFCAVAALVGSFFPMTAIVASPVDEIAATLESDRKIVFKQVGDQKLMLDVFDPKGVKAGDRRACLLAFHGGSWKQHTTRKMYPFLAGFVKSGMVGISAEYRLLSATNTVFDCVKDARSAVRYVREHATELGIDPEKIIVMGESAGGHLGLSTTFPSSIEGLDEAGDNTSVSCVANVLILLYPVSDTSKDGFGNKVIGPRWADLSAPRHIAAGMPPTLIFQGTLDKGVPLRVSQALHDAMVKAGNRCELEIGEGGGHGYVRRDLPTFEATLKRMREFLESLGLIDPTLAQ